MSALLAPCAGVKFTKRRNDAHFDPYGFNTRPDDCRDSWSHVRHAGCWFSIRHVFAHARFAEMVGMCRLAVAVHWVAGCWIANELGALCVSALRRQSLAQSRRGLVHEFYPSKRARRLPGMVVQSLWMVFVSTVTVFSPAITALTPPPRATPSSDTVKTYL
jgi:hypothetical protein